LVTQFQATVKAIMVDNGSEFMSITHYFFILMHGIEHKKITLWNIALPYS